MILYHYALSPFSSKVRAMLGYSGLAWDSVVVRSLPPRPEIHDLVGGYRKIPVAQIGADLFCDSRIIAAEIARLAGRPLLDPALCPEAARDWAEHTDLRVFMNCLALSGTLAMGRKVWAGMSLREIVGFVRDRIAIGRRARVSGGNPRRARERVLAHLDDCESRLDGQPWLFGDTPCHADFSAWHSLRFIHELAETDVLADYPLVQDWFERLRAFGEGRRREITADEARAVALAATPRVIAPAHLQDERIGREVSIAPDDYALDPTPGRLAGVTPARWIIARETPEGHVVHVHFPRQGYTLSEI